MKQKKRVFTSRLAMASDNQENKPASKSTQKRKWRALGWFAIALCITLFVGSTWLLNSERGAQFAFSAVGKLSAGMVESNGITGQLSGPLNIKQLKINLENQNIVVDDIAADLQLSALFGRSLHVTSLQIGKLSIVSKIDQSKEPSKLPDSIALPIKLKIDKVQVNAGTIAWGPVDVVTLGAFAFNLDFDGARYALNLDQFSARSTSGGNAYSGKFKGQATLSTVTPYPLQATVASDSAAVFDDRNIGATGNIVLDGSLADLKTAIDLRINKASLKGNAVLRPFSEKILGSAYVSAQAIDLAELFADLPKTNLNIKLDAAEDGKGKLAIRNAAADTYDENRIPLTDLSLNFAQQDKQFIFNQIVAKLGSVKNPAGSISGNGRYADGALALSLKTDALDLKKLDQRMRNTKLMASLDIRHASGKQTLTLSATEALKRGKLPNGKIAESKLTLNAHAVIADEAITVDKAELRVDESAIDATAHFAFNNKQEFNAKGTLSKFNPRALGNFSQLPAMLINAEFAAKGMRLPSLQADLSFRMSNSQLAGNPLTGEGQARLTANSLHVPKLLLVAGKNRINAEGKLEKSDARISFAVQAPALEQLGSGFAGVLQINGEIRGDVQQPRIVANWQGNRLRIPGQTIINATQGKTDISLNRNSNAFLINSVTFAATAQGFNTSAQQIAKLSAQAQFSSQANAPLSLVVSADGIGGNQLRADTFNLDVSGTTAQHTLNATLAEREQNWKISAAGGLKDLTRAPRWEGAINAFDAVGHLNARLNAPAKLLISQKQVQLDQFKVAGPNASIAIEQFLRNERGVTTRGKFEHVKIGELMQSLNPAAPIGGDLALAGEWNLSLIDKLDGTVNVRRESGDVVMRGNASAALGLNTLNASATATKGRLALNLLAEGKQTGRIDINLNTTIGGDSRFSISPNAPVSGSARMSIPTLGWLGPLISPALIMEGSLQSNVALNGTFGQPRMVGPVTADGLRLLFTDTGVDLKQGVLRSAFDGNQLVISNLSFQNEGSLVISGPLSLVREQLALELTLKATRYKLIDRSDRKFVISGDALVGWRDAKATAKGQFEVDSGYFDIGTTDTPELSDDVVIVGKNDKPGTKATIALDVGISLGEKGIHLYGRGLDAMLVGKIQLLANAGGALRALGTLRVASGTFKAYQRELAIEQGSVRFSGPLDNPALDILAMRRGQEVEAGVSVRGTVLAPRITLVSEPTVSDAEKLSWLVLGRGLAGAGDSERDVLQSAAGSLLASGGGAGLQSKIAGAFGLDDVSIGKGGTDLQERIVKLGKRISSKLYVGFQQSMDSASSVLLVRYTLTSRITLEGEAGTNSAISLFYNFAFD
ncbi:translocation/assembly module TamB domain-containing protein [Herminiimonas fonticola]|nr:translocation/assembly module TamB domain-containing protein [Herminiimonas fonticola]